MVAMVRRNPRGYDDIIEILLQLGIRSRERRRKMAYMIEYLSQIHGNILSKDFEAIADLALRQGYDLKSVADLLRAVAALRCGRLPRRVSVDFGKVRVQW